METTTLILWAENLTTSPAKKVNVEDEELVQTNEDKLTQTPDERNKELNLYYSRISIALVNS